MTKVHYIKFKKDEGLASISKKALKLFLKTPFLNLIRKNDIVGIKIHFGEKGNKGYIKPEIVRPIADTLKKSSSRVFITDTNTLYIGRRSNAVDHIKLAEEHGFCLASIGMPIIIADGLTGRNYKSVDINGRHLKNVKIASDIAHTDFLLCLSHMTGHMQAGFGAAIKNLGMGCASRAGKLEQHSNVLPEVSRNKCVRCGSCVKWCPADAIIMEERKAVIIKKRCIGCGECAVACKIGAIAVKWSESIKKLQEKMAEYALGVVKSIGREKIYYINFLNHITKDCDCMAKDEHPICEDLGIMASTDPVALDKASVDEILKENKEDVFKKGYPDVCWTAQLNHANEIGLGSIDYRLEVVE